MTNATTLDTIRRQAEGTLDGPAPLRPRAPATTRPETQVCPYCGHRESGDAEACSECRGLFEPLSQIATQNAMGPWQVRDEDSPFRPGCSLDTLRSLIRRGRLTRDTVLRGPTTRQFWKRAGDIQGVAHLLGSCHACRAKTTPDDHFCRACGASFIAEADRNWLGLDAVRPVPAPAPAQTTEPKATPAHEPVVPTASPHAPVNGILPAPGKDFLDVFAQPAPAFTGALVHGGGGASSQLIARDRRRQTKAVGHAVAAATVALCAAALSVAIWAASAAQAVEGEKRTSAAGDAADLNQPLADPADLAATPVATNPPESWYTRMASALAVVESEDIPSLEQAVSVLRDLAAEHPEAAAEAGLPAQIETIERRVDDLTIRKFLRGSY